MCGVVLQCPGHVCLAGLGSATWQCGCANREKKDGSSPAMTRTQYSHHGWQLLCWGGDLNQLHELKSGTELLTYAQPQSVWCVCCCNLRVLRGVLAVCNRSVAIWDCSVQRKPFIQPTVCDPGPVNWFLLQAPQLCTFSWPCIQPSPVTSQVHPPLRRSSFSMDPTIIKESIGKNPDISSFVISCTCYLFPSLSLCPP